MTQRTCSIEGCEGITGVLGTARGLCSKHYQRWRLQQLRDPLARTRRYVPHGRTRDPNYGRHNAMMQRCYNPGNPMYKWYGARGITVHESWHDVVSFCDWIAANLGPCPDGHSLDRIDNNRGYEPGNVRWATDFEQVHNRRRPARRDMACVVCGGKFTARAAHAHGIAPRSAKSGRVTEILLPKNKGAG